MPDRRRENRYSDCPAAPRNKDIADNGVSEEELQRVKTQAAVNEIYAKDSMSSQASMMGRLEARGFQYTDEQEIHRRLQAVSAQEVQAAARMLTDERMSTVIMSRKNLPPRQAKKLPNADNNQAV